MKKLLIYIFILAATMMSCIDDSFTTSPADQPRFSVDTLDMGVVFTDEPTVTFRFTVSNPSSKSLSISSITMGGTDAERFRMNVDGFSGASFRDVEIRGRDSIFVFVAATLPESGSATPTDIEARIDFVTNGITKGVIVKASGQDIVRLPGVTIGEDTRFDSQKPYRITDSLIVAEGATLTLSAGTHLLFHDKSFLKVRGRLVCEGDVDNYVVLSGDRTGNVVSDISFDLMSRQWAGVLFCSGSKDNVLSHTIIKNTSEGVIVDGYDSEPGATSIKLINSRLRNSASTVFAAAHADVTAIGCEFAEGGEGLVYLCGGQNHFAHCTFANNYLFAAISDAAIQFDHFDKDTDDQSGMPYMTATVDNSIIYGLGPELSHGDLTGSDILIRRCLLKSAGTDDDNFLNCLWGEDPLYYTVRNEYIFDYRLKPESPAIAAGDLWLMPAEAARDGYGLDRGPNPDLGAYVFTPVEEES